MGIRFRKSVKLAPGVRMNFSGSGVSLSLGPRGASVNFGKRGTYISTGIPGTGLYARERIGGSSSNDHAVFSHPAVTQKVEMSAVVSVENDGSVIFKDMSGNPLREKLVEQAKKQRAPAIHEFIQQCCEKVNAPIPALAEVHLHTPNPRARTVFRGRAFDEQPPVKPAPRPRGFLGAIFASRAERIATENQRAAAQYQQHLAAWQSRHSEFLAQEAKRKDFVERRILEDTAAMEEHLEHALQDITWPRETKVSFEISEGGKLAALDVDLPEIRDMPTQVASVPGHQYRLALKKLTPGQIQKLYMTHVHGVGFRVIGEVFAILPTVSIVLLSAFSQRSDAATGVISDEYLYSVKVTREQWEHINFDNLMALNVVDALAEFDLQRDMTRMGVFKPVQPISVSTATAGPKTMVSH